MLPWQEQLALVARPNYAAKPPPDWIYLRTLSQSSMVDVRVYQTYRSGDFAIASSKLPDLPPGYLAVVNRNKQTFSANLRKEWMESDAAKHYQVNLDYFSGQWHSTI